MRLKWFVIISVTSPTYLSSFEYSEDSRVIGKIPGIVGVVCQALTLGEWNGIQYCQVHFLKVCSISHNTTVCDLRQEAMGLVRIYSISFVKYRTVKRKWLVYL